MKNSIALIGMPGVGKTSVGKAFAANCGLRFIDTDSEIVKLAGCSIPEIFRRFGEEKFRKLERDIVRRMSQIPYSVLSCGGGVITVAENAKVIKQNCFTVYLRASVDTLVSRVGKAESRPLLTENPREKLTQLLEARGELYLSAADGIIDCDGLDSKELAVILAQRIISGDSSETAEIRKYISKFVK